MVELTVKVMSCSCTMANTLMKASPINIVSLTYTLSTLVAMIKLSTI